MTCHFYTQQDLNLKKIGSRMVAVSRLDGETFRELRDDPSATLQSVFVVAIIGLCYGAGLGLFQYFVGGTTLLDFLTIILIGLLSAIVVAAVWSYATFLIVTKLFRGSISYWGLARPFFFSWAPGLLFILILSPILAVSEIIRVVGAVWIVIANVFAVKQAARVSIQQSMLTFIIGALVLIVIQSLFSVI